MCWQNLIAPGLTGVTALLLRLAWQPLQLRLALPETSLADRFGDQVPQLVAAAACAMLAARLGQFLAARRLGAVPKLMRQIIAMVAWLLTCVVVAGAVFDVPLGSLVTTSGMMVAVIGIALKNMISDLATGLSLPVKVGDWIEVQGNIGRVVEVSWRATRLITRDEVTVIIPNTHLMAHPFQNLSQPEPSFRDSFRVTLPADLHPDRAERLLLSAAREVPELAAHPTHPELFATATNERGVEWELRYFVPDAESRPMLRSQVMRNLLRNLTHAGIALPAAMVELHRAQQSEAQRLGSRELAFLRGIELFDSLTDNELGKLVESMERLKLPGGLAVVTQGEAGSSLFVLKEGMLEVSIADDSGKNTPVGQIVAGQFFGEMSLMTGAPRSATITTLTDSLIYEITHEALASLLKSRAELVQQLSTVLAERQLRNAPKLNQSRPTAEERRQSLTQQLMARVNEFFRLG